MKRLVTNHDILMLDQELDIVVDTKNIKNNFQLNIIGGDVDKLKKYNPISVDQIKLRLDKSDLADSIIIDTTGRVYMEGDSKRLTSPYVDELITLAQLGMRLNRWFNDLPIISQ